MGPYEVKGLMALGLFTVASVGVGFPFLLSSRGEAGHGHKADGREGSLLRYGNAFAVCIC